MNQISKAIRYCKDIGCFALDFPKFTCAFRTEFCNENCYNIKMYRMYKDDMVNRDRTNLDAWTSCTVQEFVDCLKNKRNQTSRFRFATRGEVFYSSLNIAKIREIAIAMPDTIFWIPTRAWRNAMRRSEIMTVLFPLANVRVMASIDPSNSLDEVASLKADGWSTIFYGDDTATDNRVKCTKTWNHTKGACAKCTKGCFSENRVDVHLKKH
jgi:hypothetical protein